MESHHDQLNQEEQLPMDFCTFPDENLSESSLSNEIIHGKAENPRPQQAEIESVSRSDIDPPEPEDVPAPAFELYLLYNTFSYFDHTTLHP